MTELSQYVPEFVSDSDREAFVKGQYGERIGWGRSPAVIVVDITNQFTQDEYALGSSATTESLLDANERLLNAARQAELPIFYTRGPSDEEIAHVAMELRKGGEAYEVGDANEICEDLEPRDDEIVIEKTKPSAFFDTHLAGMLTHHDIDTAIVTGVSTSGCVRATVVDASSHNFRTIVPAECVADRATTSHEMALFEMQMKYADILPTDEVVGEVRTLS
ncbi:isochorismatase family protein [Natrialba sp. INN-245]|uniref:isochorismatase family protein n=1 Tax=Natrialba sp. INN-245 TaxID=2690967 RepID=UPI0013128BCF|nr:isochorismatase family protein [Natrialba sp. INN-245]MWV38502.1 isochorismatase family protein [Natrialba sp. INN-245]